MEPAKYKLVKDKMTSSVRMMMDHLKRYLDEGKAAALVGAGFSRNAMMNEACSALGFAAWLVQESRPKKAALKAGCHS